MRQTLLIRKFVPEEQTWQPQPPSMPVPLTAVLPVPVPVPDTTEPVTVPERHAVTTPEQHQRPSMQHQAIPSPQPVPAVLPVRVPQEPPAKRIPTVTEPEHVTPRAMSEQALIHTMIVLRPVVTAVTVVVPEEHVPRLQQVKEDKLLVNGVMAVR